MIEVAQVELITAMYEEEGLSIRTISRTLGISRNTVRKVLEDPGRYLHPARRGYKLSNSRPCQVLSDKVKGRVKEILKEDSRKPRKKRRTSRQVFLEVSRDPEIGYIGAESTLRRYIATVRPTLSEVRIPLEFSPGEAAQVDWTDYEVIVKGRGAVTFHIFCFRLCYSRTVHAQAFFAENQESFFEGHCEAFKFVGGIPSRAIYDNLKSAVFEGGGKNATEQREFTAFRVYHGFKAEFCNPGEAHEKGQVEHVAKIVKREFLVGIREVESLDHLNRILKERCKAYLARKVPDSNETVVERLNNEQLRPLPEYPWECCKRVEAKVSPSALVQYQTNRYSVPCRHVGCRVLLKAYPNTVEVWNGLERIAVHQRSYDRGRVYCQLDHYLEVLLMHPRALQNARAYRQADLPAVFGKLLEALSEKDPIFGPKEMIRILMLQREFSLQDITAAVTDCLNLGFVSYDAIRQVLAKQHGVTIPLPEAALAGMPRVTVTQPHPRRFNVLLGGKEQ
ncbi:MAG: IS21 family transposase [Firmicutes bacterium]|nr:IS21 family transposase [Bacillota bacterium]